MRGIDTNVLIRAFLVDEDPAQVEAARSLLEQASLARQPLFVSLIVLCEFAWVLRSAPYRHDRGSIARLLEALLEAEVFVVEDDAAVADALEQFRNGRGDFPDYLIGIRNRRAGCMGTVTFDRKVGAERGFTLLETRP